VVPTFIEQVKAGGPVTVTDPAMTRYFMTVDEAVQLVLQASALAVSSELFLLDMGDPVKIDDLARRLIRLAGLTPGKDIAIEYTGRRPGEKLDEVLANQPLDHTSHDKIYDARLSTIHAAQLMESIADLEVAASNGELQRVVELLNGLAEGQLSLLALDLTETTSAAAWS
jgi:FlaA1/EpsC-like NDP-sugar epimerase